MKTLGPDFSSLFPRPVLPPRPGLQPLLEGSQLSPGYLFLRKLMVCKEQKIFEPGVPQKWAFP